MKNIAFYCLLITFLMGFNQCSIKYSFTGASISPSVKTYTISDFPNRARLVNPTLSDYVNEQLRDKFTRQTSLDYANNGGDLEFEGSITGYDIKPIAVQKDDVAAQNRLSIEISVKFTNNNDHDQDFDTSFSAYYDFSSEYNISDIEETAVEDIITKIVDDVFNKSVANW